MIFTKKIIDSKKVFDNKQKDILELTWAILNYQ